MHKDALKGSTAKRDPLFLERAPEIFPMPHFPDVEMDAPGEPEYIGECTTVNLMSSEPDRRITLRQKNDHTIGVILFLLAVLLWTVSGFVMQVRCRLLIF